LGSLPYYATRVGDGRRLLGIEKRVDDIVSPRANSSTPTRYCTGRFRAFCGEFRIASRKESALLAIIIAPCLNLRRTIEIILKTVDSL
jgi:hypothetical protein